MLSAGAEPERRGERDAGPSTHRAAGDGDGDAGVGIEREVRTMLLERAQRDDHDPPRNAIDLRPGGVWEICHRVLNYRARPLRRRGDRMSSTPEQLETTAVEPEPEEATATPSTDEDLVVEDLLVEDVSIDGMCGVY